MSLTFGSNAMRGLIEIKNPNIPANNGFSGDAMLTMKSNNQSMGVAGLFRYKNDKWFYRMSLSYTDYADYRIPIDTINYLSWKMPLYNQRVKNTAGNKSGVSFSMNYQDKKVNSWIHISDVYGKNGFFPGAHGIPDISRLKHDGNFRNVEMPYSWSNHLKFTNNTKIKLVEYILHFDLGFQQNHRQELSVFHTHYANQQPPKENPDLESEFRLNTLSSNINYTKDITSNYRS